ncbi:MAG: hypothetical protein ACLPKI_26265 [Streptosporangiaceae bacterium]
MGPVFHHTPAPLRPLRDWVFDHTPLLQKTQGDRLPAHILTMMAEINDDLAPNTITA